MRLADDRGALVEAGLSRGAGDPVPGTGCAGVGGACPPALGHWKISNLALLQENALPGSA